MKKIFFSFLCCLMLNGCKKNTTTGTNGTCSDGILNQNETAIDCGGVCSKCPTCSDGIQNQGETGIDCGGPCGKCDINYPFYGLHGRNILHNDTISIKSSELGAGGSNTTVMYSISSELFDKNTLKIIIKGQQSNGQATWYYNPGSVIGWSVKNLDYGSMTQELSVNFPVKSDVRMYFEGTGWAVIDIYENGAIAPTRQKTISWKP